MHINIKNIVICMILIIILNMSFNIVLNITKNNYLKKVIKSESQEILKGYIAYNDITIVLNKYLEAVKNSEYNKLNDMSLFYAKRNNSEYNSLKDKLQLKENDTVSIDKIYVLDKDIYRCVFNVKSGDKVSSDYTVCIKLDTDSKYFRVLDFTI